MELKCAVVEWSDRHCDDLVCCLLTRLLTTTSCLFRGLIRKLKTHLFIEICSNFNTFRSVERFFFKRTTSPFPNTLISATFRLNLVILNSTFTFFIMTCVLNPLNFKFSQLYFQICLKLCTVSPHDIFYTCDSRAISYLYWHFYVTL